MKICATFDENGKNDAYSISLSHIAKTANPSSEKIFGGYERRTEKGDWVDQNARGLTETKAAINEIYPKFLSNETFAYTDGVAVQDQRKFSTVVVQSEGSNSIQKISSFIADELVQSIPETRKYAMVNISEIEDNKSSHDGVQDFELFSMDWVPFLKKVKRSFFALLVLVFKLATVGIWEIALIGFLLYISYLVATCTLWESEPVLRTTTIKRQSFCKKLSFSSFCCRFRRFVVVFFVFISFSRLVRFSHVRKDRFFVVFV